MILPDPNSLQLAAKYLIDGTKSGCWSPNIREGHRHTKREHLPPPLPLSQLLLWIQLASHLAGSSSNGACRLTRGREFSTTADSARSTGASGFLQHQERKGRTTFSTRIPHKSLRLTLHQTRITSPGQHLSPFKD